MWGARAAPLAFPWCGRIPWADIIWCQALTCKVLPPSFCAVLARRNTPAFAPGLSPWPLASGVNLTLSRDSSDCVALALPRGTLPAFSVLLCPLTLVEAALLCHPHGCSFCALTCVVLDCRSRAGEAFVLMVDYACEGEEVLLEVRR